MRDTLFIRLLQADDKGSALAGRIQALREGRAEGDVYTVNLESFRQVPNTPFCYWVSERIRRLFKELPPFESEGRTVKQGLATVDDFRFVRAWWEVPAERILDGMRYAVGRRQKTGEEKWTEERIREFQAWCRKRTYEGKRWVPFAKGGEYSPYYADIHLVVNWEKEGSEIKHNLNEKGGVRSNVWMLRDTATNYFFRPELTWPRSTVKGLNMRVLSAACVFADKGPAGFVPLPVDVLGAIGLFNSKCYHLLIGLQQGSRAWEVGTIQKTAIPSTYATKQLCQSALTAWSYKHSIDFSDDTSHAYRLTTLLTTQGETLYGRLETSVEKSKETEAELQRIQAEVDDIAFDLYGFTEEERKAVVATQYAAGGESKSEGHEDADDTDEPETAVEPTSTSFSAFCLQLTGHLLSWCVVVYRRGRIDLGATGEFLASCASAWTRESEHWKPRTRSCGGRSLAGARPSRG